MTGAVVRVVLAWHMGPSPLCPQPSQRLSWGTVDGGWAGSGAVPAEDMSLMCGLSVPTLVVLAQPFNAFLGCVSALAASRTAGGIPQHSHWPLQS